MPQELVRGMPNNCGRAIATTIFIFLTHTLTGCVIIPEISTYSYSKQKKNFNTTFVYSQPACRKKILN